MGLAPEGADRPTPDLAVLEAQMRVAKVPDDAEAVEAPSDTVCHECSGRIHRGDTAYRRRPTGVEVSMLEPSILYHPTCWGKRNPSAHPGRRDRGRDRR
jgi:hypothetical protein